MQRATCPRFRPRGAVARGRDATALAARYLWRGCGCAGACDSTSSSRRASAFSRPPARSTTAPPAPSLCCVGAALPCCCACATSPRSSTSTAPICSRTRNRHSRYGSRGAAGAARHVETDAGRSSPYSGRPPGGLCRSDHGGSVLALPALAALLPAFLTPCTSIPVRRSIAHAATPNWIRADADHACGKWKRCRRELQRAHQGRDPVDLRRAELDGLGLTRFLARPPAGDTRD